MTLGTMVLTGGAVLLGCSVIATVVCLAVGSKKKKRLDQYLKEWY